ncbi:hypothetical protein ACRALDRAFT_1071234 [Sodiomyces alcalophilus JCM 7366]|uniref:uncharacterized protein n=1 Tax=Sodiomyces alcalophilus JCM 7366 TaxID=591952 RepID=UPI0039B477DB
MFLHSGASLHGHEFSKRPPTTAGNHNPPHAAHAAHRLRSAFAGAAANPLHRPSSPPSDRTAPSSRRVSFCSPTSPPPGRPRPHRPLSYPTPFQTPPVVRFQDEPVIVGAASPRIPSSSSSSYATSQESVSHLSDTISEETIPVPRQRPAKQKTSSSKPRRHTSFVLAYPPPRLRTKQRRFVQIRPRLLLQLRQLSPDRRPKPAIDVLATCVIAGTHAVPRLVRHVPAMVRAIRGSLGRDDLVVAKSEDYDAPPYGKDGAATDKESRDLDKREWVAVISPLPSSSSRDHHDRNESVYRAEIVLADGAVWNAEMLPNGSYEFVHVDAGGRTTTARWVKRSPKPGRVATTGPAATSGFPGAECRFTFSMIDPSSRRHPILATLTPSSLDVMHSYKTPSPPSAPRPSPPDVDPLPPPRSLPVDEATRTLIMVTSVWVWLHAGHGWPAQAPKPPNPLPVNGGSGSCYRPSDHQDPSSMRATTLPAVLNDATRQPPAPTVLPRRALSTGAAYMLRRQAKLEASKSAASKGEEAPDAGRREETAESKGSPGDTGVGTSGKWSMCRRIRGWRSRISSSHSKREEVTGD